MARVEIDMPAMIREFNRQGGPALAEKTVAAVEHAKREGPRNPRHHRHIVDQLHVGPPTLVRGVIAIPITSSSPFWHFLEFGTSTQPASRPITRGAQAQGLKVLG